MKNNYNPAIGIAFYRFLTEKMHWRFYFDVDNGIIRTGCIVPDGIRISHLDIVVTIRDDGYDVETFSPIHLESSATASAVLEFLSRSNACLNNHHFDVNWKEKKRIVTKYSVIAEKAPSDLIMLSSLQTGTRTFRLFEKGLIDVIDGAIPEEALEECLEHMEELINREIEEALEELKDEDDGFLEFESDEFDSDLYS